MSKRTGKTLCLILFALFGVVCAQGQAKPLQATPTPAVESELRQLELAWLDAYDNNDAAAMERIVADDFQITYGDGRILNKKQTIAGLKPSAPKDANSEQYTEDSVVRVYGNTAIITGVYIYKHRDSDKETMSRSRYTDTYLKRKGRWQVVSSHLSPILTK
jgi:ketosteroid isomerase-like protein